jgi:hypothetical protein
MRMLWSKSRKYISARRYMEKVDELENMLLQYTIRRKIKTIFITDNNG